MAANYIVINSKFKPFSYEEMLHPVQMATSAHQQIENEYTNLATKANIWEEMADEQSDPYAYNMYKTYANDLEKRAGQLAREGLNPLSRQSMLEMKQRYSSDILPIEQAYARRKEFIDQQRELLSRDNTYMFDIDASNLSLDDLIKNPELTFQSYAGTTLAKQVGTAAANLAREMRDNPRKWRSILGNQYFETLTQKGYRPEEIIKVILNDENASPILKGIVEDAVGSSNIANWNNKETLNRAYEYANQGLWNAVGETQYQNLSNKAYDYAMRMRMAGGGENKSEKSPILYRAVPRTTVDGKSNTVKLEKELNILKEILNNPDLIKSQSPQMGNSKEYLNIPYSSKQDNTTYNIEGLPNQSNNNNINKVLPIKSNTYINTIYDLAERYGTNLVDENYNINIEKVNDLAKRVQRDIYGSAIRDFSYVPNVTDQKNITDLLHENINTVHSFNNNFSGLIEYKNGEIKERVKGKNYEKYFEGNPEIHFEVGKGFIITNTDEKGKKIAAVIDPEVYDTPDRAFRQAYDTLDQYINEGANPEYYNALVGAIMGSIYKMANTRAESQSKTTSKDIDVPIYGYEY